LGIASPSLLSVTSPRCFLSAPTDIHRPLPIFWMLVTFRGSAGLAWACEMAWKRLYARASGRPVYSDVQPLASLFLWIDAH
jgi:hypothetical protein